MPAAKSGLPALLRRLRRSPATLVGTNAAALRWPGMRFLAIIITGLSLIAPGAHAFELLNKIGLPEAEYFVVQQIYGGWWIAGLLLPLLFWPMPETQSR
jgi:hypothetical protein